MPHVERRTPFFVSLLTLALTAAPLLATCGGGGGGGMGGFPMGGGSSSRQVYRVPWNLLRSGDKAPASGLILYWFPTSADEARGSELQTSRPLTMLAAKCVTMALVTSDNETLRGQYSASASAPVAVLAGADGKEVSRVSGEHGLSSSQVEKLVNSELKKREDAVEQQLSAARDKEKGGDAEGATALYSAVWGERCLFPSQAKKAAKELKKLGHPVPGDQAASLGEREPSLDPAITARMVRVMADGLDAENAGQYLRAAQLYREAWRIDPGDPVAARYLGELYRHHTGDWKAARQTFNQILAMPADPVSRAVALHGLGKMTIHEGDFALGLSLLEKSIATWPLALTYRNLAVYWNSEGQVEKAQGFAQKALDLDPADPYNQIFMAAFSAEDGKREEALRIARNNEDLLAASYNLAAIYTLLGDRDKALELLQRHFYTYERFDAVRSKEMKEAREDIVFTALKADAAFVALTAKAEPSTNGRDMPGRR